MDYFDCAKACSGDDMLQWLSCTAGCLGRRTSSGHRYCLKERHYAMCMCLTSSDYWSCAPCQSQLGPGQYSHFFQRPIAISRANKKEIIDTIPEKWTCLETTSMHDIQIISGILIISFNCSYWKLINGQISNPASESTRFWGWWVLFSQLDQTALVISGESRNIKVCAKVNMIVFMSINMCAKNANVDVEWDQGLG